MAATSRHRSQHLPHPPRTAPSTTSTTTNTKPSQQQIPLSKRLLFPHLASNDLPPLLASPSTPPELTAELYDFIALALRAFVNPWWTKITRYDKEFLPEITHVLTAVLRSLEARVQATDLFPLVFCDIPTLVTQHYVDYRNATSKLSTSYASGGAVSLAQMFHQLQPHMAVSADGKIEVEYFRQVVDQVLKACLPPEDYEPEVERFIVREIILKVVLEDVIPKITQPWFVQKVILDLLDPSEDQLQPSKPPEPTSLSTQSSTSSSLFSFHNLLVFFLSAIQSISGFCLALIHSYKQALSTIKLVNQSHPKSHPPSPRPSRPRLQPQLQSQLSAQHPSYLPPQPSIRQTPTLTPHTLSHPLSHLTSQLHPPAPTLISPASSTSSSASSLAPLSPDYSPPSFHADNDYADPPLIMLSEIFTAHDRFASSTIVSALGMLAASMTPFLDRLLPYFLESALSAQFIINTVRTAKRTLFPNGYPAPTPPDPTLEEQAATRERLVAWRGQGGLAHLTPLLLGPDPSATLGAALDPLTSAPCNVHLTMMILDRVLVALFPELGGGIDDGKEG